MALKPQVKTIPPDLAAVLADAPIHPALLRAPLRPAAPTAATLTGAALALAEHAAAGTYTGLDTDAEAQVAYGWLPTGARALVHAVGGGGVLHLEPAARPRAISLAHGVLDQRCASRPKLRPGAVRLLPPGLAVTLADLEGNGALAVEVVF
ncbi:MAG TPA: hypothetical protein VFU73_00640 [Actinocrinis sp.]|nr:hypothetical protein [Actinocrinis sp.]